MLHLDLPPKWLDQNFPTADIPLTGSGCQASTQFSDSSDNRYSPTLFTNFHKAAKDWALPPSPLSMQDDADMGDSPPPPGNPAGALKCIRWENI